MRPGASYFAAAVACALVVVVPGSDIRAQGQSQNNNGQGDGQGGGRPEWAASLRHDTSRPLREIAPRPGVSTREDFEVKRGGPDTPGAPDTQIQSLVVAPLAATGGVGFDGVGEFNEKFSYQVNHAPPDTVGEAGLTQYVQWVNPSFAIFDKASGNLLYGPAAGNTIWAGFGGDCETRNDGDPMVQYDQLADRWVMSQFSLRSGNYLQCVAVSKTSDATGQWHRYAFLYNHFPDYPKLAVWPDAYYMTFNMFGTAGQQFTGARVCAYDRTKMLDGLPATQICFQPSTSYHSLLASDLEGKTLPPAGSPNYVMNRFGSGINVWKFKPDFATPSASTFTGPTPVSVTGYSTPGAGVPQPQTTTTLDTLGDRLMYRLAYRNLGTREALVVNHSVAANGEIGVRWYEFNVVNTNLSVRQESTYAPDDNQYRWMGSIAMDKIGNIAIGFSISSATERPSIRFAGRETSDPLNTMSMDTNMHTGIGSQTGGLSRWGDYSSMTIDPVDDCTFWYTSEYLNQSGTFNWSTRVGSFKFSSCSPAPAVAVGVLPASNTITAGQFTDYTVTVAGQNGYSGSGSYSVTGLPGGAIALFSPEGFTGSSGSTTMTVATTEATPPGTYQLTVTAADTSGAPSDSEVVTLVVNPPSTPGFTLSASPSTQPIEANGQAFFSVIVTSQNGYSGNGTFTVSGLPAGVSGSFAPATYTGGSGNSTLTLTAGASVAAGSYPLSIIATDSSGAPVQSTNVTLVVNQAASQDFTLTATPGTLVVKRGKSGSYNVAVTPSGGFNETVALSVTGVPASAGSSFNPSFLNGGGSSTLSITAGTATPRGTFTLTITATSNSRTRSIQVTLKVN